MMTITETMEITGIPGHEFRQFATAGFVREFSHMRGGGVKGPDVSGDARSGLAQQYAVGQTYEKQR
jgi:hypothetical protein